MEKRKISKEIEFFGYLSFSVFTKFCKHILTDKEWSWKILKKQNKHYYTHFQTAS